MATQTTTCVVVWEWLNEFGRWRPYDPRVSDFVETCRGQLQGQQGGGGVQTTVALAQADPKMAQYAVDLVNNQQIRLDTGLGRPIRRQVYNANSPAGTGVSWQWIGDLPNQWHPYDMEVAIILEDAFNRKTGQVDLSQYPCRFPYTVDFHRMTQTRNETGFPRKVKRVYTGVKYMTVPMTSASVPGTSHLSSSSMYPLIPPAKPGLVGGTQTSSSSTVTPSGVPPGINLVKKRSGNQDGGSPKKVMTRATARSMAIQGILPGSGGGPPHRMPSYLPPHHHFAPLGGSMWHRSPAAVGSSSGLPSSSSSSLSSASSSSTSSRHSSSGRSRSSRLTPAMTGMTSMLVSPAVPVRFSAPGPGHAGAAATFIPASTSNAELQPPTISNSGQGYRKTSPQRRVLRSSGRRGSSSSLENTFRSTTPNGNQLNQRCQCSKACSHEHDKQKKETVRMVSATKVKSVPANNVITSNTNQFWQHQDTGKIQNSAPVRGVKKREWNAAVDKATTKVKQLQTDVKLQTTVNKCKNHCKKCVTDAACKVYKCISCMAKGGRKGSLCSNSDDNNMKSANRHQGKKGDQCNHGNIEIVQEIASEINGKNSQYRRMLRSSSKGLKTPYVAEVRKMIDVGKSGCNATPFSNNNRKRQQNAVGDTILKAMKMKTGVGKCRESTKLVTSSKVAMMPSLYAKYPSKDGMTAKGPVRKMEKHLEKREVPVQIVRKRSHKVLHDEELKCTKKKPTQRQSRRDLKYGEVGTTHGHVGGHVGTFAACDEISKAAEGNRIGRHNKANEHGMSMTALPGSVAKRVSDSKKLLRTESRASYSQVISKKKSTTSTANLMMLIGAGNKPDQFIEKSSHFSATKTAPKSNKTAPSGPDDALKPYVTVVPQPPKDEDCCICCEQLTSKAGFEDAQSVNAIYRLNKCEHMFHRACLCAMYESGTKDGHIVCPTCKTIYGQKMGNCPPGKMDWHVLHGHSLPGHEDCDTIRIIYYIPHGIQGPEHPHPGHPYTARGFPRHCYLPNSEKGQKVLRLLKQAWDRRLLFTVGSSATTGESDTVVWNEIHHKTEFGSNHTGHGYPDPNYLDNVLMELAVQGVPDDS